MVKNIIHFQIEKELKRLSNTPFNSPRWAFTEHRFLGHLWGGKLSLKEKEDYYIKYAICGGATLEEAQKSWEILMKAEVQESIRVDHPYPQNDSGFYTVSGRDLLDRLSERNEDGISRIRERSEFAYA